MMILHLFCMNIHLFPLLNVKTDKFYDRLSFQNLWIDQHSNTCSIVKININLMITKSIDDSDYENPSVRTHTINPFCFTYPYLGLCSQTPQNVQRKWNERWVFGIIEQKKIVQPPANRKTFMKRTRIALFCYTQRITLYQIEKLLPQ